ncbi:MAG: SRPBCC family protein [Woeseiaceae bacterium]|nr:SRPBCC family protein [Woeseiaceae bacterium]
MSHYGERVDEKTVRFERWLPGPLERVWDYLTDSDKRATWFAGGETELRVGGKVEMNFHNASLSTKPDIDPPEKYRDLPEKMSFGGTVTRCEPPLVLAHTWDFEGGQSEVCYELEEAGDQVRLVLTHRKLASFDEVLSVSGGWHTHLDILEDVLEGREPDAFWKAHAPLEDEYKRHYQ